MNFKSNIIDFKFNSNQFNTLIQIKMQFKTLWAGSKTAYWLFQFQLLAAIQDFLIDDL